MKSKKFIFRIVFSLVIVFLSGALSSSFAQDVSAKSDQALTAKERWKAMSPEQKQLYRERLDKFKGMDPQKQKQIKKRHQRFKNLSKQFTQKSNIIEPEPLATTNTEGL